ncbi:MAG TPA: hypothetical protein PLO69_10200 [Gammaproteobacteria bacterium]|nr:hypothetical protein [Gammaproteobacteria bacterium]
MHRIVIALGCLGLAYYLRRELRRTAPVREELRRARASRVPVPVTRPR